MDMGGYVVVINAEQVLFKADKTELKWMLFSFTVFSPVQASLCMLSMHASLHILAAVKSRRLYSKSEW